MSRARQILEKDVKQGLAKMLNVKEYMDIVEKINQSCQLFYMEGYMYEKNKSD